MFLQPSHNMAMSALSDVLSGSIRKYLFHSVGPYNKCWKYVYIRLTSFALSYPRALTTCCMLIVFVKQFAFLAVRQMVRINIFCVSRVILMGRMPCRWILQYHKYLYCVWLSNVCRSTAVPTEMPGWDEKQLILTLFMMLKKSANITSNTHTKTCTHRAPQLLQFNHF